MRKKWLNILVLMIVIVFFRDNTFGFDKLDDIQDIKVKFIKSEFERMVGGNLLYSDEHLRLIHTNITKTIKNAPWDFFIESQFFVYVDRNPKKQFMILCFFDARNNQIKIIGIDKVSTGNPDRKGYFITPIGFFKNTTDNFGYRALGVKNDKGWRGLGAKGSRIWDFGWQKVLNKKGEERDIRLLIHATDPDFGEIKLGKIDSKGCVRVSAKMNNFLDYFGILDKEYESRSNLKKVKYLLRNNRISIKFAGKYLIVGDSSGY